MTSGNVPAAFGPQMSALSGRLTPFLLFFLSLIGGCTVDFNNFIIQQGVVMKSCIGELLVGASGCWKEALVKAALIFMLFSDANV